MIQSNSKLLNYIHLLMTDDAALHQFLVDPIQAEENHGITKAERAVLRRTVAHLSNNSKNGYSVARHSGSYRRSLRLLQNVLHHVGSKMVQDSLKHPETSESTYSFSMIFNFPNNTASGPVDYTFNTNADIDKIGGPYAWATPVYTVSLDNPNPTVQEVYDAVNDKYFATPVMPYETVTIDGAEYVKAIVPLGVYPLTADLSKYTTSDDYVFWFYSINGRADGNISGNSGNIGESFATKTLNAGDTVFWQLIAPDAQYHFLPCN
ncbi:hypothetical protein KORDIASMS9_00329 [Kordia sp. SMS9]|uniref:hypothetical protein n=1 Tax=Kordia sp. SMS9 TaxID=2282170 RepID=UPI000E0D9ABD|nr:hypothetical protein [Kordia sp. SMS9]AXG68139.1 hypothetical protein KORDIASMS9_00329 [Kordia sp. SMS9]